MKNNRYVVWWGWFAVLVLLVGLPARADRRVVSLDGTWHIAEGSNKSPASYCCGKERTPSRSASKFPWTETTGPTCSRPIRDREGAKSFHSRRPRRAGCECTAPGGERRSATRCGSSRCSARKTTCPTRPTYRPSPSRSKIATRHRPVSTPTQRGRRMPPAEMYRTGDRGSCVRAPGEPIAYRQGNRGGGPAVYKRRRVAISRKVQPDNQTGLPTGAEPRGGQSSGHESSHTLELP